MMSLKTMKRTNALRQAEYDVKTGKLSGLVKTIASAFVTQRVTRVAEVIVNELGTIMFVMEDGGRFSRDEFRPLTY